MMYAVVRQYTFDPANAAEIDRKIKDGFVPLLKSSPGFVAYYWVDTGEGKGASLSVFETLEEADHSVLTAADFVHEHLNHLLSQPDVFHGEIKAWG
jgi:hypothetical protein